MMLNIKPAKLQDQIKKDESEKILHDQGCCQFFGIKALPLSALADNPRQSQHFGINNVPSFVWMDNQAQSQYYGIESVPSTLIFTSDVHKFNIKKARRRRRRK